MYYSLVWIFDVFNRSSDDLEPKHCKGLKLEYQLLADLDGK